MPDNERIEGLRRRESKSEALTPEEQAELDAFYKKIEAAEAAYLTPATERLRTERLKIEESVRRLQAIRDQKKEAARQLAWLIKQIESLTSEERRILTAVEA